jgi:sugar diacid utilization regulator
MTDLPTNAMRDQLDLLLVTARRVAESLELDTVLTSIVEDATTLLGADSGDILLWDRDRDVLRVVAVSNFPPDMLGFEFPFGEGLTSQAIPAQRAIEVADYRTYEHRVRALDQYDFGTVLCAPLLFRGAALGAINVHAHAQHHFPLGSADLLAAFAGHAAIAIDHARRYENEVSLGRDLAESNRELTRLLTVQQRLAEHVLLDGGPIGIATVLAEDLARDVVIKDHLHRLIAGASPDGGDAWRWLLDGSPAGAADGSGREPFEVSVRVGREVAGHLLLSSDDDLGAIDRALVHAATTGVALAFAKERAAVEVEERLRGEAATDLLSGTYASEEAIALRAARLGYDLGDPRDLLLIDVGHDVEADAPGTQSGHDRQRRVLDVVRERLAGRAPRSLAVAVRADSIVVLASATRSSDLDVRELARDLQACVAGVPGAGPVSVVVGDRCERPDDYAPAFRLARESVELMLKLGRAGAIVAAKELGPYGLLLRASSRDDLEAFARRTLRPLLDYDRRHGGELLRTLRVFLEEDRVRRRAAARCFVHVNTVVYRVHRIEELLGVDLGDPSTVFDITLALRIVDLLGDAPLAASGAPTAAAS